MRVRKASEEELVGKRIVTARHGRIDRSPDDEGYQCGRCGFVLVVTGAVASDPLAAFCCPFCGAHTVRAD